MSKLIEDMTLKDVKEFLEALKEQGGRIMLDLLIYGNAYVQISTKMRVDPKNVVVIRGGGEDVLQFKMSKFRINTDQDQYVPILRREDELDT